MCVGGDFGDVCEWEGFGDLCVSGDFGDVCVCEWEILVMCGWVGFWWCVN